VMQFVLAQTRYRLRFYKFISRK